MKVFIDRNRFRLYVQIGLAFLLLHSVGDLFNDAGTLIPKFFNNLWRLAYLVVINFVLFEYTLPSIRLSVKRILLGVLRLFAHMMLYSFGLYAWRLIGIQLNIFTPLTTYASTDEGLQAQMAFSVGSVAFFGIIRYTYDLRKLKETAQQLRIEKQAAELNYLKSQTNPHFLFNTLNNIYSLARDKSDLAPESILRLSKILRFMLYETGSQYIALEQELKIMNDYIALERLRYDDSLRINFNYDVEDMKQALPPLLLIPLVENAFKHGVSETRNQPFIDIHLSVKQRQLAFFVKNSSDSYPEERGIRENIGLSNLRRQLDLQYTDYSLSLEQKESVFAATLTINLNSHV